MKCIIIPFNLIVLLLIGTLITPAMHAEKKVGTNITLGDVKYTFKVDGVYFHKEGYVERGFLAHDHQVLIGDVTYTFSSKASTVFYSSGKVKKARLIHAHEVLIGENKYSFYAPGYKRSYKRSIGFYESGKVKFGVLNKSCTVNMGKTPFIFKSGRLMGFYENGKVKFGVLNTPYTVNMGKTPFTFKSGHLMDFYENGLIKGGHLSRPQTVKIKGKPYVFYVRIYFYENGNVKGGLLHKSQILTLGGVHCRLNSNISFYEDGTLQASDLKHSPLRKLKYPLRRIVLYPNGQLKGGVLSKDRVIAVGQQSFKFKGNYSLNMWGKERVYYYIHFYSDGSLQQGTLAKNYNVTLNGISYTFAEGKAIYFSTQGQVIQAYLKGEVIIDGKLYQPPKGWIRFFVGGKIAGSSAKPDPKWQGKR